jgi:PilZ domain-containing protein
MLDRRQLPRHRVYYGGLVAFNGRHSTVDCVVRNFSLFGAKIEFENVVIVPDEIDFEIERKAISCTARLVWRSRDAAGVVFANVHEDSDVVSLDWARKLRASERANRRLKSRLDQILSEH